MECELEIDIDIIFDIGPEYDTPFGPSPEAIAIESFQLTSAITCHGRNVLDHLNQEFTKPLLHEIRSEVEKRNDEIIEEYFKTT